MSLTSKSVKSPAIWVATIMLLLSNPAPRVRLITISIYEVGHEAAPPTPLRRQMQIPSGACPNKLGQAAMTCHSATGGRGQPPVSLQSHPQTGRETGRERRLPTVKK